MMTRQALAIVAVTGGLLLAPPTAAAADKTHQQIMAEIRMLQEQQQQLQQLIGGLAETLKGLSTKIDEQTGATRKAFADQRLVVDGVAEGVRMLREKADDTNVRLSSMTQELQTLRQTLATMPPPSAGTPGPSTDPADPAGGTAGAPGSTTPPTGAAPPPNVSHQRVYDLSYADYTGGQYDLAVTGFEAYIRQYPTSPLADDAQLNIGNAYYGMSPARYRDAAAAFLKVISDYPQSDSVPAAYWKLGQTYERLNQPDAARKAYETVVERFGTTNEGQLARQALDRLNRKG